jgi:hypothetical protein
MKLAHLLPKLRVDTTIYDIADEPGCSGLTNDIANVLAMWKIENQDNSALYEDVALLSQFSAGRIEDSQFWRILTSRRKKKGLKEKNLKYLVEILDLYELKFVMEKVSISATLEDLELIDCFGLAGKKMHQSWVKARYSPSLATMANSRNVSKRHFEQQVKRTLKDSRDGQDKARVLDMVLDRYHQKFGGRLALKKFSQKEYTGQAIRLEKLLIEKYPGYDTLNEYEAYHLLYNNAPSIIKKDVEEKFGDFDLGLLFSTQENMARIS